MLEPLPIDDAIDDVREALRHHTSVVIVAEPGAGKTTRVPPALISDGPVILLQPRRAAARAIARRIATERGWTIGREVGWHVRLDRRFDSATSLIVATEGILTRRLQQDPLLSDFRTIVLDEFHERSIHADVAIALSKQATLARADLKLVVMSATIDAGQVSRYLGNCPVITVPGRMHPTRVTYADGLDVGAAAVRLIRETSGTLLCFQPGTREIREAMAQIASHVPPDIEILPLHGSLPAADQDRALDAVRNHRRIIVCTNIAETSITVPGVTGVIDSGLEKVAHYDAERAVDSLDIERITQAAADQRAGRAGRTAPGVVYRLWSASDRLRPFREPEIHRVDLGGVVLDVLAWGGDPRTLDWFEPPRADAIVAALRLLERLQAIRGLTLTAIGRQMQQLPLPPRMARMVIAGNGSRAVIRVCAILAEARALPPRTATTSSDLLSALDRWHEMPSHVHDTAAQIERLIPSNGPHAAVTNAEDQLLRAVLAGYPDRVAQRRDRQSNRFRMASGTGAALAPECGVRDAEYLVALDLQAPTRPGDPDARIRLASAIDGDWLEPTDVAVEHRLDEGGVVRAAEVRRYDALVLSERPVAPDAERAVTLLAAAYLERPIPDSDARLLRRARFAACDLNLRDLIAAAAYGMRSLDVIDLARVLPAETVRTIDRHAPDTITVPSGRSVRLEYGDDGSVSVSVKLQELFGLAETPRVGPRQEPVLLSLLAPNGRPVQVTRDLRSFWTRTYPDVRRELRGRYPKHPWPEDPWNATPTARAKPRA